MLIFVINRDKLSELIEISEAINRLSMDLKAETIIAAFTESHPDVKGILVSFNGQLQRIWSKDISFTKVADLETGDKVLLFHLNRDGIYDMLPEALFHGNPDNQSYSAEEMAKDSMKLRKEEKESRSFFQPFENEIFNQTVQLAVKENQLFRSIYSESIMGLIPGFWNIPEGIPENYRNLMVKLLPLAFRITGNLDLTAQSLEFILKEKVTISTTRNSYYRGKNETSFPYGVLEQAILGVDSVAGNFVSGDICRLVVSIGPVHHPGTDACVKDGSMERFLQCFFSYFIPMEFDVETKFIFGMDEGQFILNEEDETSFSYLGYNSMIL